ncbi:HNH endonuclease [Actinoplanes sp. ATCC 53533]|uniref:HNH endonuclease family protein n=1 Tax=Actinoplanes sp. ATCC 53533 TaxID=1288362 RepID=UPI000F7831E8|nr:HNH endonuclease family protein [Actinoplanes sp. ATCC 53533]RSM70866.1 HNH endonuclease [Actinoplanes sp. ATCC 53533]
MSNKDKVSFWRRRGTRRSALALIVATVTTAGTFAVLRDALAYGPGSPPSAAEARQQWSDLRLAGNLQDEFDTAGYSRARFPHWRIVGPPNGQPGGPNCTADKWTKIRDRSLGAVNGCETANGTWVSGYDNVTITNSSGLDIDHIVPLHEAWKSGADEWTDEDRAVFANDVVVNLVATSPASNRSKGDQDPASWMPPNAGIHCQYLTWWVEVKVKYDLDMDNDEYDAVLSGLNNC